MPTIAELRAKIPELNGLDDQQAVDAIHQAYYPTADRAVLAERLGVKAPVAPNADGDFMRGVKKAGYQIPQTIGGTMGLIGDATGADGLRDYGMKMYQNNEDKIQGITKPSDSLTSVLNGEEGADGVAWLKNAAGYTAGQALTAIATGGAGGFIGSQLAKRGIREVVARGAESAMARQVAANAAARGAKIGALGTLGASNLVQEAGSIYPEALAQAKLEGRTLDGGDLARVAGSALAAAAVDTGMDAFVGHKVLAGGRRAGESLGRAALREVPGMAAKESVTEGIQTGIERYGAQQDLTTADAIRDYVDSMGVGAVGGGMGGGVSVLRSQKQPDTGPLSRAANVSIDAQILQLEHDPQPLVSFPDGSVGHKQDVEAYLTQFDDPEERLAKRRELFGLDPKTGKKKEPEPAEPMPDPTSAPSKEVERETLKSWGARHDPATLEHAQALMNAPGAKGQDLMVAPHPNGGGFTVVPSNWLTIDSQAKLAALQRPQKEGEKPFIPVLTDKLADSDGIPTLHDQLAPSDGIPVLNDRLAPADGIPVLTDVLKRGTPKESRDETVAKAAPVGTSGDQTAVQAETADTAGTGRPVSASGSGNTDAGQPGGKADADPVRTGGAADTKPALAAWELDPYAAHIFHNEKLAASFMKRKGIDPAAFAVVPTGENRWGVKPVAKPETKAAPVASPAGTIDLNISEIRRKNGAIGTQGVVEEQVRGVLEHAAGMTIPENASMREMIDGLKADPAAQQRLRDFTAQHPIDAHEMPDGSLHLNDGHHRAFLLNQLGDQTIPATVRDYTGPSQTRTAAEIHAAANEAATSPLNDLPEPTPAQKEAGNYKVGRVQLHGLDISIENPAGSTRSGVDKSGKPWTSKLESHYGYIRKTLGADGDHVDAFIGPDPQSDRAFVVDQVHPEDGKWDEHKVILGAHTADEARAIYQANYAKGWQGAKDVTETSVEGLKAWLKDGDTTKPFAPQAREHGDGQENNVPAGNGDAAVASDAGRAEGRADPRRTAARTAPAEPGPGQGVPAGDVPPAQETGKAVKQPAAWQVKEAKKDAKLQDQIATAKSNAEKRAAEKEAKSQSVPVGNESAVIPSDNTSPAATVDPGKDDGSDIPLAFYKDVTVPFKVWIEDEKAFSVEQVDAHTALKSARDDIANLQALLKCMKG